METYERHENSPLHNRPVSKSLDTAPLVTPIPEQHGAGPGNLNRQSRPAAYDLRAATVAPET